MKHIIALSIFFVIFSFVYYAVIQRTVLDLCDVKSCPLCYGKDLCKDIQESKIVLQFNTIKHIIYNVFSVKNVFYALYEGKRVVLKKLAHNSELEEINNSLTSVYNYDKIINILISESGVKHFKICDEDTAQTFLNKLNYTDVRNIVTIIYVNIEPILLQIFNANEGWCVPKFYGFCGRLAVMEDAGRTLNAVGNLNWFDRSFLAFQIMEAAKNFTENHAHFRLYLTDISPDNIVVNQDLKITFIDLENAILHKKTMDGIIHHTTHFKEDVYIFSEKEICDSSLSDHNIYAVCRLILSENALWPMMKGGLLHSPPEIIRKTFSELFTNIEMCVHSTQNLSRFDLSEKILKDLRALLIKYTKHV